MSFHMRKLRRSHGTSICANQMMAQWRNWRNQIPNHFHRVPRGKKAINSKGILFPPTLQTPWVRIRRPRGSFPLRCRHRPPGSPMKPPPNPPRGSRIRCPSPMTPPLSRHLFPAFLSESPRFLRSFFFPAKRRYDRRIPPQRVSPPTRYHPAGAVSPIITRLLQSLHDAVLMETPAELAQLAQRSDQVAKLLLPPNEEPAGELMNRLDLWLAKMARIVTSVSSREKMAAWGRTCHSLLNAISAVFARESKAKQVGGVGGKTQRCG